MSNKVLELLRKGHRNMGHVLALVRTQTDLFGGPDDLRGLSLLNNAIDYMQGYPSVAHHPTEEVIFSKMTKIRPSAHGLCVGLQDQHAWFRDCHAALQRLIRGTQAGEAKACELLIQQLRTYCAQHFDHVSLEEAQVYPLAEELLTVADWDAALMSFEIHADPLLDPSLLQRYESIYDYLMENKPKPTHH